MKALIPAIACSATLVLAGCSSSVDNPAEEVLNQNNDFTTFVKQELENTEDDRKAVAVNDIDFSFNDRDNPQAYNDVLR